MILLATDAHQGRARPWTKKGRFFRRGLTDILLGMWFQARTRVGFSKEDQSNHDGKDNVGRCHQVGEEIGIFPEKTIGRKDGWETLGRLGEIPAHGSPQNRACTPDKGHDAISTG